MEGRTKCFNGVGDAKEFITKVELYSALKGYSKENVYYQFWVKFSTANERENCVEIYVIDRE